MRAERQRQVFAGQKSKNQGPYPRSLRKSGYPLEGVSNQPIAGSSGEEPTQVKYKPAGNKAPKTEGVHSRKSDISCPNL